jgi:hypothetical protein
MGLTDRLTVTRMPGSSIAAPPALAWVTDLLNAAYFARPRDRRDVDDLRLAYTVLTTWWYEQGGRRLGATDAVAFHRAFGVHRLKAAPRLTLDREALLAGAASLLGDWFPAAAVDPARRAHGIAFRSVADREAYDPTLRLRHAALGELSPPTSDDLRWATYPPVRLPDPDAALAFLRDPGRWPDMGSEGGRFTALRGGGLDGQTFEIEVVAVPVPRARLITRGYVTATEVHEPGAALDAWVRALTDGAEATVVPDGGRALLGVELTTHRGHFLGRARSNLVAFTAGDGAAFIRDIGCWDPLPPELAAPYAVAGRAAQHAFWGPDEPDRSMLAQLATVAR